MTANKPSDPRVPIDKQNRQDPRVPLQPRGAKDKRDLWGRRGPRKLWDIHDPEGPLDPWDTRNLWATPDPQDPQEKPEYWVKLFLKYLRKLARKIFNVVFLFTVFIFFYFFFFFLRSLKNDYHWIIIITVKHQTYDWIIWILKHLWF